MKFFPQKSIRNLFIRETGVTTVEYAIILALIAAACIFAITQVGLGSGGMWGSSATELGDVLNN